MQGFPFIRFVHKFFQDNAVVRAGRCHAIVGDQGSARIRLDVIFIAKKTHSILLHPTRIGILVRTFILVPFERNMSGFDSGIFLSAIALLGNFNDRGVDDRAAFGENPLGFSFC